MSTAGIPVLRGCVIALLGDFGEGFKHVALSYWIKHCGGIYADHLSEDVTHLVCSRAAWVEQDEIVQHAIRIGKAWIVKLEWLTKSCADGILEHPVNHSMGKVDAQKAKDKQIHREVARETFYAKGYGTSTGCVAAEEPVFAKNPDVQFNQGVEAAQESIGSGNYHWYRDDTGFVHSITTSRADPDPNHYAIHDFELHLFEINDGPPFYYATAAWFSVHKFVDGHMMRTIRQKFELTCNGSSFAEAYFAWRLMFRCLTGVDWELRFWVTPNYRIDRTNSSGTQLSVGNSLHGISGAAIEEHREYWNTVQRRCPAHIRDTILNVLHGIFRRKPVEPRRKPLSAYAMARKNRKLERQARAPTLDVRTGLPKARTVRFNQDLSSSENEDEDEYDLVDHIHCRYFMYQMPPYGEPRGDNTFLENGTRWFGPSNVCEQQCNTRSLGDTMYRNRTVQDTSNRPAQVGGGLVEHRDWRMFKEGFKTSGRYVF